AACALVFRLWRLKGCRSAIYIPLHFNITTHQPALSLDSQFFCNFLMCHLISAHDLDKFSGRYRWPKEENTVRCALCANRIGIFKGYLEKPKRILIINLADFPLAKLDLTLAHE